MTKSEFLEKPTVSNTQWAAQQILLNFEDLEKFKMLQKSLHHLSTALYKSWAQDMPLSDIIYALQMCEELQDIKEFLD